MCTFHCPSVPREVPCSNILNAALALIAALALLLGVASTGQAYPPQSSATLMMGSASGTAGGSVNLTISLAPGSMNVCTLQFDLLYSSSLSYGSVATGSAAAAAQKTASGNAISGGARLLVFNVNQNIIGAGPVAIVTLMIAPGTPAGSIPITISNLIASDPSGNAVAITPVDGALTVRPPADTTPPVISAVASSGVSPTGATITWNTNEASDSQVDYGTTTAYGSSTTLDTSMVTSHSQALSGLSGSTTYHYRVKSKDAAGNLATSGDFTFTTSDSTPPVISAVATSGVTATGATITWTTNEASDSRVDYGTTTAYGSSTTLDTSMVTSHSQALSGLSGSTTYHYRVKSRDAAGNLATSGDFTFTTADGTPPVISAVASSGVSATGATITWNTNEASDSQVEYGTTTAYGSSTTLNTSMVTSHSQALSGLSGSTTYHFRVKSKDAAGNLATSGDFTFATTAAPDTTPPIIDAVASSAITSTSATITWATDEASDSQVEYGTTAAYGSSTTPNTSMVTTHSQALTGLVGSTTYHYRIKSRDAAGNLATSGDFTFTTADGTPPVISVVASSGVSATGATITWNTNEASDSQVEYGTGTAYGSSTTLNTGMVTSHSQALSGLSGSTTYHYRVKSKDAAGNLATSGDFTFATTASPDTTPPIISAVASSAITSTGATIAWATDEASDSQVEYGTTAAYGSSTPPNTSMVTAHSQALTGLVGRTTYHYRVKSKDATGNLATSGDFTFTTADGAPPLISAVASSGVTATGATITWTTNEASDSQVDYGTTTAYGSSTTLDVNLVTSHSTVLTGLTGSTTYHYRVQSKDAAGNLATSGDFTFATAAAPDTTSPVISGVTGSGITSTGATITWTTNEASDSQVDYGTTTAYGSSTTLNTSMVTAHSQALTGLIGSTTYHYRVKSKDAAGNLATSGDFTFATSDSTPLVISAVASSSITSTGATIKWTTNEASDSQVDYGTTTAYGSSTTLNIIRVTAHSAPLTGLTASTTYHYRVKSKDAGGNLATSGDYTFATAPDTTAPMISGVFTSNVSSTGATIKWTTNEASDSLVDYGTTTSYGNSTTLDVNMVTSHSMALTGLTGSTTYHCRVKSKDAVGNLATSGDFTFMTLAAPDTTPPIISGVASANVTNKGATIAWTTNEASDSQVDYGTTASYGASTALSGLRVTSHSMTLMGLSPSTTYHYRVKSKDAAGNLGISADYVFTTAAAPDTAPPVIYGIASSGVTSSGAIIVWTTNEASDSQVDYGTTPSYGKSTTLNPNQVTQHSQTVSGLTAATTYHFRAKSKDAAGNRATSPDYTFTTLNASTAAPVISRVAVSKISSQGATVTWDTDVPSTTQVLYGLTNGCEGTGRFSKTMVTSHSQGLSGLLPDTTYYFSAQSKNAAGALGTAGVFSFHTTPSRKLKLVYPRLATNATGNAAGAAGEPVDNSQFTGIAIANLGATDAVVTFTAHDETGAVIAGESVTNPVERVLSPGAQLAIVDVELFGSGLPDQHAFGWIDIESSIDAVTGFTITFNASLSMIDGAPISPDTMTQFVFTEIEDQGFTELHVANPNISPANVTFQLVQSNGMLRCTAVRTVNPLGSVAESMPSLFPDVAPNATDYIRVVSDANVVPFQLLGEVSQDIEGLNGLDVGTGATMLYCPQYAVGGAYRSTLSITNLDGSDGTLTLRLIGDDGAQIGPTKIMPIVGNGKVYISDQSFFAIPGSSAIQGYVEIESNGPRIAGTVVFGDPDRKTFITALPLVSELVDSMVFSHVASDTTYFMGIALVNPSDAEQVATIDLYRMDGALEASVNTTIPAGQRLCQLLDQLFPQIAGQNRTSGYVRVTVDQGVAGFSVFGTRDLKTLSAIPAQILR